MSRKRRCLWYSLQAKKDLADSAEQAGQTQAKKPDKNDKDTVKEPSKENPEDSKAPVKEEENLGQQEALQQAALQQAAAQAAGMMVQEAEAAGTPEAAAETVPEALAVDMQTSGKETPTLLAEEKAVPVRQEAALSMAEKAPQAEAPKEKGEPEPAAFQVQEIAGGEKKAEVRPDTRGQEKREDTGAPAPAGAGHGGNRQAGVVRRGIV